MPSSESAIVKLVRSRIAYSAMKVNGPMQAAIGDVVPQCLQSILEGIAKVPRIDLSDASELTNMIATSFLPNDSQAAILTAVDAKACFIHFQHQDVTQITIKM